MALLYRGMSDEQEKKRSPAAELTIDRLYYLVSISELGDYEKAHLVHVLTSKECTLKVT